MTALIAQIQYRLKAVLAATFLLLVGVAEWLVNDPQTATLIQQYLPDPWNKFVPGALGAIGVWFVHHYPNAAQPATASDEAPQTELPENLNTTLITAQPPAPSGN